MKKLILILLLLVACEPHYGGALLTECETEVAKTITVHIVNSPKEELQKLRGERRENLQGFGIIRSDNTADLYLPALRGRRDDYRMEVWGHEFSHVICGDWHPANEKFFD